MSISENDRLLMSLSHNSVLQTKLKSYFYKDNEEIGLAENELSKLLIDFEVDESFAPAMQRIISSFSQGNTVNYSDILKFFALLMPGNMYKFFEHLALAIDSDKDHKLNWKDLVDFGQLLNDPISEEDAKAIIRQCNNQETDIISVDAFVNWFKTTHNLPAEI